MRRLVAVASLPFILITPASVASAQDLDTVPVAILSTRLLDSSRQIRERTTDFRAALKLVRAGPSERSSALIGLVSDGIQAGLDPDLVSRNVGLLVAYSQQRPPTIQAIANTLRRVLGDHAIADHQVVLLWATDAPAEVRDALVDPTSELLLAAEGSQRQQEFLGQRLVLLGSAGRAEFERLARANLLDERVVRWVRHTTGGVPL